MTTAELKIKEYEQDIQELKNLLGQSTRANVKQFLNTQIATLQSDLTKLQKSEQDRIARLNNNPTPVTGYTKKIDSYGWDQSEKFVKIYITSLANVNSVKQDDVVCTYTPRTFDLMVKNLNNVNYNLVVNNLCFDIVPDESYVKVKTDMIAIFLKKAQAKNWSCVTEKEMKAKEKAMPKLDENADPQDGLMSMMKKMYEEGDDEMKRTISKAFTESREKSLKGEKMEGLDI